MRRIDELHLEHLFAGARMLMRLLKFAHQRADVFASDHYALSLRSRPTLHPLPHDEEHQA
jgi:hypothetical protein